MFGNFEYHERTLRILKYFPRDDANVALSLDIRRLREHV